MVLCAWMVMQCGLRHSLTSQPTIFARLFPVFQLEWLFLAALQISQLGNGSSGNIAAFFARAHLFPQPLSLFTDRSVLHSLQYRFRECRCRPIGCCTSTSPDTHPDVLHEGCVVVVVCPKWERNLCNASTKNISYKRSSRIDELTQRPLGRNSIHHD